MYILPFKRALGCFGGVVVYLSFIWLFWCYLTLLKDWSGLFCLWLPGNPDVGQQIIVHRQAITILNAGFILGAPWLQGPWGLSLTGLIAIWHCCTTNLLKRFTSSTTDSAILPFSRLVNAFLFGAFIFGHKRLHIAEPSLQTVKQTCNCRYKRTKYSAWADRKRR